MIYLDLFDGVKSAHPKTLAPEWWRPNTFKEQEQSRELARAELMVRLLYGDTVVLSDSQAIDSVAWLQVASDFSSLKADWIPLFISIYGVQDVTPEEALLDVMLKYFSNPNFLFSAWIGLDSPQREIIVANLKRSEKPHFGDMLGNIGKMVNADIFELLESQALGLQKFHEYLTRNRDKGILIRPKFVGPYIWPRMKSLKDLPNGIPEKILLHLENLIGLGGIESRSRLYYALANVNEPTRTHVRKYVDRFYNEKIGLAVSGGKGVYTITDHDPRKLSIDDEELDALADNTNTSEGLLGRTVLQYYPQKLHDFLSWDEFLEIIEDYEFSKSVIHLRRTLDEYDLLDSSEPQYFKKYRTWLSRSLDALNRHQDLLARYLASKAVQKDNKLVIFIGSWVNSMSSLVGGQVAYGIENLVSSEPLSNTLFDLIGGRKLPQKLMTTAAGRIRTALKTAVDIKPDEYLLK
jgi:hypothetical protein